MVYYQDQEDTITSMAAEMAAEELAEHVAFLWKEHAKDPNVWIQSYLNRVIALTPGGWFFTPQEAREQDVDEGGLYDLSTILAVADVVA